MNRPDTRTMVLGHPLVATPIELGGCLSLIACWQAGADAMIPAAIVATMMAVTAKAGERAAAYRKWKREWDALADPATLQPKWKPGTRLGFALGVFLLFGGLVLADQDRATNIAWAGVALDLGVVAAAVLLVRWLFRRLRTRRGSGVADAVAVVAKPILAAPSLDAAYAALPAHCLRLLAPVARG